MVGATKRPRTPLDRVVAASGRDEVGFWQSVHDAMREAVIIVGPDRRVLYANEKAQGLLTVPIDEAQGRPCLETMNCPQCECMCRLFETGKVDDVEVTLYTPEPRTFRKNARLLRDVDGEIIGGVETFTETTEARAARAARARLPVVEAAEAQGVFSLDRELRVLDFDSTMAALTGFAPEAAAGQDLAALLQLEGLPGSGAPSALAGESFEVGFVRQDGQPGRLALHFESLPFGPEALLGTARGELVSPPDARALERAYGFFGMLSRSPKMRALFRIIRNLADSDANVMIEGESGTGKELVAQAIHALSARRVHPFFAVNCATFTGSLLLSELFGHERGAFTGACRLQRGKLELAEGGTLLLDEVSEIPIEHQALLLRVLESRRFERLGGTDGIPFRARVVAATNRPLAEAVEDGSFRRDLFFRLNVVPVRLPPLRARPEDVALLFDYFARQRDLAPLRLSPEARRALEAYAWPGNVRELKNLVEYLSFVCEEGEEVRVSDLPDGFTTRSAAPSPASHVEADVEDDERGRILAALESHHYHKARTAAALGVDRTTLWRRMKKHGLDV